jgi:hypothetical protein
MGGGVFERKRAAGEEVVTSIGRFREFCFSWLAITIIAVFSPVRYIVGLGY